MSDMLGISSGAIGAYQRALSTVSNNIANVNTEGYSRQDVVLQDSAPQKVASMYMGTGVMLTAIKRQFDTFAESNLRNSASDLANQQPMVDYTKRVMDILGDKTVGLSSALDTFFSAASALSADPASTVLRTSFLQSGDGVASRFGELSGQMTLVVNETNQALQSAADQVNTLTSQLAAVNQNMTKSPTEDGQPAELLDQRDLLLRKLSDLVRVKTSFAPNGAVTVSLGSTMTQGLVVDGLKARPIGLNTSVAGKTELVLDPYGKTETLASTSGGQISGIQSFISQVLEPTQKSLDQLANTFVNESNTIQKNGVDGYGQMGQNMFAIDSKASNPAATVQLALNDGMRVATAAQFRVSEGASNSSAVHATVGYSGTSPTDPLTNKSLVNNPNPSAGVTFKVEGAHAYTPVTQLSAGVDAVFYLDQAQPGQQLQVLSKDGRQVLGAPLSETEKLQLFTPANGFQPDATYSDQYLNKSGQDAYRGLDMFYGAKASVLYAQKFDQYGAALPSTPMPAVMVTDRIDPAGAGIPAGAITLNGVKLDALNSGATPQQVADWLNGVHVDSTTNLNDTTGVHAEAFNEIPVPTRQLDFTKKLVINNVAIQGAYKDANSLVAAINQHEADTGVTAQINQAGDLVLVGKDSSPITISGDASNPNSNALNISGKSYFGQVRMTQIVRDLNVSSVSLKMSNPLQINGIDITPTMVDGKNVRDSLIDNINSVQDQTGVVASVDKNGDLKLSTVDANGSKTISVGPGKDQNGNYAPNALGLEPLDYDVTARLKKMLADTPESANIKLAFSDYSEGVPPVVKLGDPSNLASIGLRTGAYVEHGSPDDLLLFVTGKGAANVAVGFSGQPANQRDSLRGQSLSVKFTASDRYNIIDSKTGTVLADRKYDPTALEPTIDYQGLQIKLTHAPNVGDVFQIDGNQDGLGNNNNMLDMVALSKKQVLNGKTIANSYIDQINNVGNLAQQATISQQALTVVHDQAVAARDKVSGVNLDEEAAALIRYQQAYQAAAKALQISGQLFDTINQIR